MARPPSSIVKRSPLVQVVLNLKDRLSRVNKTIQDAQQEKISIEREIYILEKEANQVSGTDPSVDSLNE